jgi:ATPase subunit of ABC transporter with duplicated ATPase domains
MDKVQDNSKPAAKPEPILKLGDFVPDDVVEIGKDRYTLTRVAMFGLRRQKRCDAIYKRLKALEEADEASEADEREYRALARELAGYALPNAPAEILDDLGNEELGDLAVAFFAEGALRSRRLAIARKLTGGNSSPDSNGSSGATTQNGGLT